MHNVSRDEQRHIGFGVKVLSELFEESEECKAAVAELLREVMRYVTGVFVPPDFDERYSDAAYGFTMEEIFAWGMRSVEAKWRATGYPMDDMPPDVYPLDPALPHAERAPRQIALLKAGVLGEPNGRPDSSPETQELLFDLIARRPTPTRSTGRADDPVALRDADPWYLRVDNGSTQARAGNRPRCRSHPEDDLGGVDRAVRTRRRRAQGDASPPPSTRRVAAPAGADGKIFPKPKAVLTPNYCAERFRF